MVSRGRGQTCSMLLSCHEVGFAKGLLVDWQRGKLAGTGGVTTVWKTQSMEAWEAFFMLH